MNAFRRFALAAVCLSICAAAIASPNLVGKWKGRITGLPSMGKATTPQQQKMMDSMMVKIKAMVINLTLKADKTFTITVSNSPMPAANNSDSGTWSQKGQSLILTGKGKSGKPHTQTLDLSKDFKTISHSERGASVQFKKG